MGLRGEQGCCRFGQARQGCPIRTDHLECTGGQRSQQIIAAESQSPDFEASLVGMEVWSKDQAIVEIRPTADVSVPIRGSWIWFRTSIGSPGHHRSCGS